MVEPDRPQIFRRMRFAWRISKATHTHSEYSASVLRYTYIAFLVFRYSGTIS